jgi:hypothetical protein
MGTLLSPIRPPRTTPSLRARACARGQSLVEFAVVLPLMLVFFLVIADFGRIFVALITVESATRDAAEVVANDYLSAPPGPLDQPAPNVGQSYYDALHARAEAVVCSELRGLPNTQYDPGTNTCPDMPVVVVCIHDGNDSGCGSPAQPGGGGIVSDCTDFTPAATSSQAGSQARWVEVRTCYHFTALLNIPFMPLRDFWLQRSRDYTIPCYFVLGTAECG